MTDIGRMLREERIARGLDIGELARRTCISSRYLIAMEEGRFQVIPKVYDKGYLKLYASALDLDVSRLLAIYEQYRRNEQPRH